MAWISVDSEAILDEVLEASFVKPQAVFKHSTRCSISSMAMGRLQQASKNYDIYIIDVINDRHISNLIEQKMNVQHQSPQLIIISEGVHKYDSSHMMISSKEVEQNLKD